MSQDQNIAVAQTLLAGLGGSRDPSEITAPFADDLIFEIQGDEGALPWTGRKTRRSTVAGFIRDIRALTEAVTFEVEDIFSGESRVWIIGALKTRIKASGKTTSTQLAIILTIPDGTVTRLPMLESGFDVSRAARA